MRTLQELLHSRADGVAANAVIDTQAGRVRILFGDVGKHGRVVLGVEGNNVVVLAPTDLRRNPNEEADLAADDLRRRMTPDNTQPGTVAPPNAFAVNEALQEGQVAAELRGGKLYVGDQEIVLPVGYGGPATDLSGGQTIARPGFAGGEVEAGLGTTINTVGGQPGTGDGGDADEDADEFDEAGYLADKSDDFRAGWDASATREEGANVPPDDASDDFKAGFADFLSREEPEGDEGDDATAAKPEKVKADDYSRDDLVALAKKEGAEHAASATKADLAKAINAKRRADAKAAAQ